MRICAHIREIENPLDSGRTDVGLDLAFQTDYPSWGYMARPAAKSFRAPLFAARTLNATGQYRVTLSRW